MSYVQGPLGNQIKKLMDDSNDFYKAGEVQKAIATLEEAWNMLPNGKYEYDESFLIVWAILNLAYNIHDEVTMNRWVKHIFLADPQRADCGDREMWGARVAMASSQPTTALKYIEIAVKKSKGRCFEKRDAALKEAYIASMKPK